MGEVKINLRTLVGLRSRESLTPSVARRVLMRAELRSLRAIDHKLASPSMPARAIYDSATRAQIVRSSDITGITVREVLSAANTAKSRRILKLLESNAIDRLKEIRVDLKNARHLFSEHKYLEAKPRVEGLLAKLTAELEGGTELNDPMLSYYYSTKVMQKFINGLPEGYIHQPQEQRRKSAVQILIVDSKGERILLQKRGLFKKHFADAFTVSANAKPRKGQSVTEAAAYAVKDEIGLVVDESRFEQIGDPNQYTNHLTSYSFYAFTPEEETRIKAELDNLHKKKQISYKYDENKRCLTVFSTDPNNSGTVNAAANRVKDRTKIPFIFKTTNTDDNSLLIYRLTADEEAQIVATIQEKDKKISSAASGLKEGVTEKGLKALDSDSMSFVHWVKVRSNFKTDPNSFALDLTSPYFANDTVWTNMGMTLPAIVNIDNEEAGVTDATGGKGSNMHILRNLREVCNVPKTSAITTFVYERLVLGNPAIRADIAMLEKDPKHYKAYAERIREAIKAIVLPEDLKSQLEAEFIRLGSDIAVRSSATSEDLKNKQAAGQANSYLHQINIDSVFESVKKVWASLFLDGFISYRNDMKFPHSQAKMAVLLQEFVNPKAAGVIYSFDQASERPIYRVSAQPGTGEGVVDGKGLSDVWLVSLLGDQILQKRILVKKSRFIIQDTGGTEREEINSKDPSLDDNTVLEVGRVAKSIHKYYLQNGLAADVDIEYVVDQNNRIIIVQTRAKLSKRKTNSKGKITIKVDVIDESKIPPNAPFIQLSDNSQIAVQGAVTAKLKILRGTHNKGVDPGVILVAHHTNNEFNSIFGSLAGVITTDGDQTSHAAQHAYEKDKPCLVGSQGAIEKLKAYDGKLVTFDAEKRRVYLGKIPTMTVERRIDLWLRDENEIKDNIARTDRHEFFRPWEMSKSKRPEVFVEDFEGHFRRRSATYGYFELDYYYKAWDRLTEILNNLFGERAPWTLQAQKRQIKAVDKKHSLLHDTLPDDPGSILYFIKGVSGLSTKDLQMLFDTRLKGFRVFADRVNRAHDINKRNVELLADGLIDVFAWMHFGFWLDAIVEDFTFDQLKYISNEGSFHNVLRDTAVESLPKTYNVDPQRADVPLGKVINLTLNKDKEMYALLEAIRENPEIVRAFQQPDPKTIAQDLREHFPEVFAIIEQWSLRYKMKSEDIADLSDTTYYLQDTRRRIRRNSTMSDRMLANIYQQYLENSPVPAPSPQKTQRTKTLARELREIQATDSNLYLLLRGFSRRKLASDNKIKLNMVTDANIDEYLPKALKTIKDLNTRRQKIHEDARNIFRYYPEIKKLLAVSKLSLTLREGGHHLIVPHQRKIGRMMLELAEQFVPSVFKKPEDIFNISTDELIALVRDPDPKYVARTADRWKILLDAENRLKNSWSVKKSDFRGLDSEASKIWDMLSAQEYVDQFGNIQDNFRSLKDWREMKVSPEYAHLQEQIFAALRRPLDRLPSEIAVFEAKTREAVAILEEQIQLATIPRVKEGYKAEQKRLLERVEDLKSKII